MNIYNFKNIKNEIFFENSFESRLFSLVLKKLQKLQEEYLNYLKKGL